MLSCKSIGTKNQICTIKSRMREFFTDDYIGAGLGYGWTDATGVGYTNTSGAAVGLTAGVSYDITNNLALDVGYRFHDILTGGSTPAEYQVTAGLRVKF